MKKWMLSFSVVLLILCCVQPSVAQVDIGFYGIGAKLGYIVPEDPIGSTVGFGIQARLGTFMPNLAFDPFLEIWKKGYDSQSNGIDTDVSYTEYVLGASAKYFFPMTDMIKPYAGGGLGFVISRSSWEWTNPVTNEQEDDSKSNSDIGLHILGGAEMEINDQFDGTFELKYSIDGADYFSVFLGAVYKIQR